MPSRTKLKETKRESLHFLKEGACFFNQKKYFEAHESWEKIWRMAEEPEKTYLKALILTCGVFIHLKNEKYNPALRLALRALDCFRSSEAHFQLQERTHPLKLDGVEEVLIRAASFLKVGLTEKEWLQSFGQHLQATFNEAEWEIN